jgi:photosystem II stability/assembly factor-like uncharacterized protein
MTKRFILLTIFFALVISLSAQETALKGSTYSGLKFRCVGPALMSGRIGDFAVNPENPAHFFVAVASGGVWKTTNGGTTWTPVFDSEGSYSIGCIALEPGNPNVIWVGTGENNSQRSVSFGDGVYKSSDGGKTWKNMGLRNSEHIGKIIIHPKNPDIVYVAAQGPLWGPGGDRGLYKTTDGGLNWKKVLEISENTGVSDMAMDPRDPDVIYASAYQRRRHVYTLVNGGPESAIYKTTNGGESWNKLTNGLPSGDVGRIGLALAVSKPDVIYAIIEAAEDRSGFFRSSDRGASWQKMSSYKSTSPQYYNEIIVDPVNADKVFSMDTYSRYSMDGGKNWSFLSTQSRHVDDHALWIDPLNTDHLLIGGDGGIYRSYDGGDTWAYYANLPVTQFYRVAVDNDYPFYNLYGGTQDNNTIGGPSGTFSVNGIMNSDWFITQGGDGFQSQIDPRDPNIVYSQYQYGGLTRFDKRSGEKTSIRPVEAPQEKPYRWNWDAPLIISPHSNTRLYFGANILFRSDDRGDSWKAVSGDLTRQLDRNQLPVFGKIQGIDAVAKNKSTSAYGNLITISESTLKEGLIYIGTDDGLIQVTEDGGASWRKIDKFPGVPEFTYVTCVIASKHDENVVYASFENRKNNDFKPYILKSSNKGRSWEPITGKIPEKYVVWSIAEDHKVADLLFAGTELGLFFSRDGGKNWIQLKGGLPVIAIRDVKIQERENDLVLASFGRGFYILDDYSVLREATASTFTKEAHIFPVADALLYIQERPLGGVGKSSQGDAFYIAPNPAYGATFTYFYRDSLPTLKEQRKAREKAAIEAGKDPEIPSMEALQLESSEEGPWFMFVIYDGEGSVVRRIKTKPSRGINRVTWDLREAGTRPVRRSGPEPISEYSSGDAGYLVLPGEYSVEMLRYYRGEISRIVEKTPFRVVPLKRASLPAADPLAARAFLDEVAELRRAALGTSRLVAELMERVQIIKVTLDQDPGSSPELMLEARAIETSLRLIQYSLEGNPTFTNYDEPQLPSIIERIEDVVWGTMFTSSAPSNTHRQSCTAARAALEPILKDLDTLMKQRIPELESKMEMKQAPWTPGRLPQIRK